MGAIAYVGLLFYWVLLYIRPADWVEAVFEWPLEFFVVGLTTAVALAGWRTPVPRQLYFIGGWVIAICLSDVRNGHTDEAIEQTVRYFKLGIVFLMCWLTINSAAKLRGVTLLMIALCAVLGLQGIYQKANGVGWAGQPLYWGDRICWIGLWDGANMLSLVLITSVPFIIESILGPWRFVSKILVGICSIYIMIGLYLANSRGGWLALASIFLVYFRHRLGWKGIVVAALVVMVLVSFGPSRLSEIDPQEKSARHRVDMWSKGLEMIKENPVFGIGKGMYGRYTGTLIAHNTIIQNAGETGTFGLFMWVGILYVSFKGLWSVLKIQDRISPELASLSRALLAAFVGYMVGSFFITADLELLYILCAFCAIVVTVARDESGEELPAEVTFKDLRNIAFLSVGGVVVVYVLTAGISGL